MSFGDTLRNIMKVELKEDGEYTPADVTELYNELVSKSKDNPEAIERAKKAREDYLDGYITAEETINRLLDINPNLIAALYPDNTQAASNNKYFAMEAITDFEGNSIPQRYRPVYIIKYGEDDYDFTKRLQPGRSLFDKQYEAQEVAALKQYSPEIETNVKYDVEPEATNKTPNITGMEDEDKKKVVHGKDELVKAKDKLPGIITPSSKVMHNATYVDPREIEVFAKNGIHPEIVYATAPKPGWWYEDNDGKKHLIRLYGITDEKYGSEPQVIVREVLPFQMTHTGYLRQVESDGFFMPVSQFKEILHNPMNKETYEEIMKAVPTEDWDNPEGWLEDISVQKQKMQVQYEKWKADNNFEYGLDQYTPQSLLNVYYAAVGKHYPIEKALEMYGKKQSDIQNTRFEHMFDDWYEANKDKYALDRFDQETLHDIFTDVRVNKYDVEDAIVRNTDLNYDDEFEDDEYEESVLAEKGPKGVTDTSKEWIISDPNSLREILPRLNINPVYVSNPFTVSYVPNAKSGEPNELDELDKRYYITGVQKPDLQTPISELPSKEHPITTIYIKDWDKKGAHPEAIDYKALRRILNAQENDNPIPDLWDRYRTYRDQKRALNLGTHYKYYDLPASDVEEILRYQMENHPVYKGTDLVSLFNTALKTHEENQFVTSAVRDYDRSASIRVRRPGDFKGYQYAQDTRTHLPTKAKNQGMSSNPYKRLMTNF